jgi:Tfp pilus assembly protein PilE
MKRFLKYIKSTKGQSLAEFAVTTAMMATLATTAAPKFSGVGEGAKEKKTLADIDKIMKSANNFYNAKVTGDGRGRFPGQDKYNETVPATGAYATEVDALADIKGASATFGTFSSTDGAYWASVFGTTNPDTKIPATNSIDTDEDVVANDGFTEYNGSEEFLNEFGGNAVKSPFQDGHYIYTVIAGSGSGTSSISPILFIADLESPKNFHKKLQP